MKAKDIMTRSVVTVEPGAAVMHAIRLMLQNRISGLPVVNSTGRLVGMLTEGDLLRRAETGTERRRRAGWSFCWVLAGLPTNIRIPMAARSKRS